MNITFCIVAWITVMALAQEPINISQKSTDAMELSRLEEVWNEAHARGDANALDSLWADDLVVTVPKMTPMTKPDVIGVLRSGWMKFKDYRLYKLFPKTGGECRAS